MPKLTIDSFNDILFSALKDNSPKGKAELLINEINMAYSMKITAMEAVIAALNKGMPYHEQLEQANNIDASCDHLNERLEAIFAENPGLREELIPEGEEA